MNVWASARIAVRALRVNKLRSALTMLGIIIGVGAVITMVAVGAGAQARVAETTPGPSSARSGPSRPRRRPRGAAPRSCTAT